MADEEVRAKIEEMFPIKVIIEQAQKGNYIKFKSLDEKSIYEDVSKFLSNPNNECDYIWLLDLIS